MEREYVRQKRLVADPSLDKEMLQEVMGKCYLRSVQRRELEDERRTTWQVSIWRAWGVLTAVRSSYRYTSCRPSQAFLKMRIRAIAETACVLGFGGFMCCCAASAGR